MPADPESVFTIITRLVTKVVITLMEQWVKALPGRVATHIYCKVEYVCLDIVLSPHLLHLAGHGAFCFPSGVKHVKKLEIPALAWNWW